MNPTGADWASVVSQSLPALAAILASAVTGLLQIWNKAGDRKHERKLKEEESRREDARLAAQQQTEHIESQRKAVRDFLHTVRVQQRTALEEQSVLLDELRKYESTRTAEDPLEPPTFSIHDNIDNIAEIGRRKIIEAWEILDFSLTDKKLRLTSSEIGSVLHASWSYNETHLFPGLRIGYSSDSQDIEPLLQQLRDQSSTLVTDSPDMTPEANAQKK